METLDDPAADTAPRPYMNPYLAGIGLGLVLLTAFVVMGRGLGASGAFSSTIAWLVSLVAPGYARSNEFLARYLPEDTHPLKAWLVFEVAGVFAGAILSALLARRVARTVEKGPGVSVRTRLALAFAGGILMAFGRRPRARLHERASPLRRLAPQPRELDLHAVRLRRGIRRRLLRAEAVAMSAPFYVMGLFGDEASLSSPS